jgi:hypothetical protein
MGNMHGRIVRVARATGAINTYVVAEPDKDKAVAIIKAKVADASDKVEAIGRASAAMLAEMGLAAAQFSKV